MFEGELESEMPGMVTSVTTPSVPSDLPSIQVPEESSTNASLA